MLQLIKAAALHSFKQLFLTHAYVKALAVTRIPSLRILHSLTNSLPLIYTTHTLETATHKAAAPSKSRVRQQQKLTREQQSRKFQKFSFLPDPFNTEVLPSHQNTANIIDRRHNNKRSLVRKQHQHTHAYGEGGEEAYTQIIGPNRITHTKKENFQSTMHTAESSN